MRKIINDPIYGFITIDDALIHQVINHPYFQRLRRISQMAMANLVYPGAVHSRLHHALGAYHLICEALQELQSKGVEISEDECRATKIAILLHDAGHGPFSHALESTLTVGLHHEELSLLVMEHINTEFGGALDMAIAIFKNDYDKKFLHQLVSGQLDVDRLDYLTRDSFFSGVSEGVVGYDRIIKMLTVYDGQLMVEEKGIYSIEKFLVARRLMYWQVYLHKTVLSAELMLKQIIKRARHIKAPCPEPLQSIILKPLQDITLAQFCALDDTDILMAIKGWCSHPDKILSLLCEGLINRKLCKLKYSVEPAAEKMRAEKISTTMENYSLTEAEAEWLVLTGDTSNFTYNFDLEHINILYKNGTVKDISEVDDALINQNLKKSIKKYYICYLG